MENNEKNSVQDPKALVEAALFICSDPLPRSELLDLAGTPEDELEFILEEIDDDLAAGDRGLRLVEKNGNYQLRVKRSILPRVKYLAPHQDISRGVLRTLSVIAYNSPVLQKEVIEIRGNGAYDHIDELIGRGFVTSKQEGRTKLLAVTQEFLDYFDIDSTRELREDKDLI
ncbi:MAG: SMC-Scp complex subunit ScpB [Candidatus Acetothermia bacterium]